MIAPELRPGDCAAVASRAARARLRGTGEQPDRTAGNRVRGRQLPAGSTCPLDESGGDSRRGRRSLVAPGIFIFEIGVISGLERERVRRPATW